MPPCRCPLCRALFPSPSALASHLHSRPECRAHAVLSRSLARVGARLCPRCHRPLPPGPSARWSTAGFVHETCLLPGEQPRLPATLNP